MLDRFIVDDDEPVSSLTVETPMTALAEQMPATGMRGGRPMLPSYSATVVESFDADPRMRRIVLSLGQDSGFSYAPGQAVVMMIPLADGTLGRRDYTIRAADLDAGTITVDILKHGDTPGPAWAGAAATGDTIEIKGPRGRTVFDPTAEWHLMTGDETCIPAIAHILETAPEGSKIHLFIEIATASDRVEFETSADVETVWVERNGVPAGPSQLMSDAVAGFNLPAGRGKAYLIGETSNVRQQRRDLVARGMPKADLLSEGYWRPGRIGGHDHVDD